MKSSTWLLLAIGSAALGVAVMSACTGADGAQGTKGETGSTGPAGPTGPSGPAGSAGPAGSNGVVDGGLATSCMSPCHGFNGIVEQWKTSTHFATYVSNLGGTEVDTWTGKTACGNCHAIDGLEQRVAGNVVTLNDGGVANLAKGEIGYRDPGTAKLAEAMYGGSAKVAEVNCTTCHAVTTQNDPHRTGLPYVKGSFPLRVPADAGDQAFLEKSADTTAQVGSGAGAYGSSNVCIWCHKSRKDVTNYVTVANTLSTNWGPHEGPQADVFSAKGGYQWASVNGQPVSYGTSTHQTKIACVDCHMPGVQSNSDAGNHSFYAQLGACTSCHQGATNFDVGGAVSQFKKSMFELQAALNAKGVLSRAATTPSVPLAGTELTDGQFALDKARSPGSPVSADLAGALYNYFLLARGSGSGVHNPKYAKQLLYDSYFAVAGTPPVTLARPQ